MLFSKKTWILIIVLFTIVMSLMIGVFVQSLRQDSKDVQIEEQFESDTKFFGLLNSGTIDVETTTRLDEEKAESEKELLTQSGADTLKKMIFDCIANSSFDYLDSSLLEAINTYKDNDQVDLKIKDLEDIRADISMLKQLNRSNGEVFFKSFKTPEILLSAMTYSPLSYKYKGIIHPNSLVFTVPESISVNFQKKELSPELQEGIQSIIGEEIDKLCGEVCIYQADIYGLTFDYILGKDLATDTWFPFAIQSQDERAYLVFDMVVEYESMVAVGILTEDVMDTAFVYLDIDDVDMSLYDGIEQTLAAQNQATPGLSLMVGGPVIDYQKVILNNNPEDSSVQSIGSDIGNLLYPEQ